MFFRHARPYIQFMKKELQNERPPANIMTHLRTEEKTIF